jgi:hypothetical protein
MYEHTESLLSGQLSYWRTQTHDWGCAFSVSNRYAYMV